MPTINRPNSTVAYDIVGTGPPVLLGHSLFCTRSMWDGLIAEMANDYRFINVELRGHGESTAEASFTVGIPGARLEVIPGAGHLTAMEQPGIVANHLRAFFPTCTAGLGT